MRFNLFQTYFNAWKSRTKTSGIFVCMCVWNDRWQIFWVQQGKKKSGSVCSCLWRGNARPGLLLYLHLPWASNFGHHHHPLDVSLLHHTSSDEAAGAPRQAWSPWKHQEMGQGQRAPQLSSVHVHPSVHHTFTTSLQNFGSSRIQLVRLESRQLYMGFFPPQDCREKQLEGIKSNVF